MAFATLTKVLCFALLRPCLGARVSSTQGRDLHLQVDEFYGVPNLDVFYTSSVEQASDFLERWSNLNEFGLHIRVVHSDNRAFFPVRVVMLGIARGRRVLLFDLGPHLREVPMPLPSPLAEFLQHPNRTFYGMDLKRSAGRLAFEFDTVVRCVDFNVRTWPEMRLGGGMYGVFNRFVSTEVDLWRPDSLESLPAQARHAYLQWAVAQYFITFFGASHEDWLISMSELYEAGPVYLRVRDAKHEWGSAREEWLERKQERAAFSIMRTLKAWRQQAQMRPDGPATSERDDDEHRDGLTVGDGELAELQG